MLVGYKYRIYPNSEQKKQLSIDFGHSRFVYNYMIDLNSKTYKETGKGLTFYKMTKALTPLKKEYEWLSDANSQVLQFATLNLTNAYKAFFKKRAKYPSFKKRSNKQSVSYPQNFKLSNTHITLPKMGDVKMVKHREYSGIVKKATVSKDSDDTYYVALLVDTKTEAPKKKKIVTAVGIDVGVETFSTLSDGTKIKAPNLVAQYTRLKRKQRVLSRKKKGSKGRIKARLAVAKVHAHIRNIREDFLHKLSHSIVKENQLVAVEDLCISGMLKNRKLSRAISQQGWGIFTRMLEYKSERSGATFVKINRFTPTSKMCSVCGVIQKTLPLSIREWQCGCGAKHDRDVNASRNILAAGIAVSAGGDYVRLKPTFVGNATVAEARSFTHFG